METVEVKSPKPSCQAEVETEERPSSPVNDCAICLEQLTDKSFTNSCFHMFCFHCLKAWSKVKPECPLCKQDFCSIIHNIRSMDDYDEYRVPPAPMRFATPDTSSFFAQSFQNTLSLPFRDILRQRDFFSTSRRFFSYRTTYIPGPFNVPRERSSRLVIQPYVDNLQIQSNYPNISTSLSNSSNLSNRKDVYLKELEIRPSNDGRHRLSSPEFYRENEGQLHRLGRWINRELAAVSQLGTHFNQTDVFALIMDMLPNYDIQSTMFHSCLFPYLGNHTRRFIKEFYNFAISPYDIEEYDRMSVYIRQRTGSSLAFIVTVGSDESEDVQVIPSPTVSHSSISPWLNVPRCPTSSSYSATTVENGARSSSSTSTCPRLPTATASSSTLSQQIIDISDSENDDCVIIDEVKSSPQTIVLDDSDAESPDSGIAPRSPIPSTSGYRPPPKISDDKSAPSTSSYGLQLGPGSSSYENRCSLSCFKIDSGRRSPSSSSVLSTDNSVMDYETDVKPVPKAKKRKHLAKPKKTEPYRETLDSYLSSSEFSYNCDDDGDSDWEANPKKKKKTKKHSIKTDKKSRKHKKSLRSKSPKRKKCAKHVSKSRVSKRSSKDVDSNSPSVSKTTSVNGCVSHSSTLDTNFSPIRPKLRSVVKKVERTGDDNLPSTSYGFRCSGINQLQSFMRRSFYSSDSD